MDERLNVCSSKPHDSRTGHAVPQPPRGPQPGFVSLLLRPGAPVPSHTLAAGDQHAGDQDRSVVASRRGTVERSQPTPASRGSRPG